MRTYIWQSVEAWINMSHYLIGSHFSHLRSLRLLRWLEGLNGSVELITAKSHALGPVGGGGKGRGQGLDDGSVELITAKSHALGPEMGEGRRRMVSETIVTLKGHAEERLRPLTP